MSTRVAILHRMQQMFPQAVELSTHWLRLRPAPHTRAKLEAYSLLVDVEPCFVNWLRDPFENSVARLDLPEPVRALDIQLEIVADLEPVNPFDFLLEPYASRHPFAYPEQLHKELEPYLQVPSDPGPALTRWATGLDLAAAPTIERLSALNQQVHEACTGVPGPIPEALDVEATLERGAGSSWELAWLLTLSLRLSGLAARFVCGYRLDLAPDPSGPDRVSLHNWSEVFLPGAGWVGLDAAAGLFTGETYLPLACTPDPMRARPVIDSKQHPPTWQSETLSVKRLVPEARSWPLSAAQWNDVRALARHIEHDLAEQGLACTSSVSLSFASRMDPTAAEWSSRALGEGKRRAGEQLLTRLRDRLAPGAVLQLGQGEWFAGESLPRWRLGCFFRADGVPVWRDVARQGADLARTFGSSDAYGFLKQLADQLGLRSDALHAAYEDPLYELSQQRGGSDVVLSVGDLRDPGRRAALAERMSARAHSPVGYALPIRWDLDSSHPRSGTWVFRRSRLYLTPGDSPLGYRLPLESLVDDPEGQREAQREFSPFDAAGSLPEASAARTLQSEPTSPLPPEHPPRTAICVEPRAGKLYVFLPPLRRLEHYLELVAAIERAAEASDVCVSLEGYAPPEDPRLLRWVCEPEVGTLCLQLPQTRSASDQLDLLSAAYSEAHALGLSAERRSEDGERSPVGARSRVLLSGTSPAQSPFVTRPRLLRGLIAYFQRHPALSYFFAGRLIGEAGGAPRPDEGRDEALYELSIALSRLGEEQLPTDPAYTDRVLRHLLTDPKGDMAGAEIRVDQLHPSERASLRLGQIQIRAFETAPEARTASLQSLLLLGLLGRFERLGDAGTLTRFGGQLHDRFMLPRVLFEDLREVIADLNAAGYPFLLEWFEPLLALRFPLLGRVQLGEIGLELSTAHEPWPLLAEEVSGGGVTRFLDVANERMQVRLTALTEGRHALVCNDRRVPLQSTGVHGEYIAGVRFKVWNPPATMHPTRPAVEYLVFDVLDLWTGRVIGGCTYYPRPPVVFGPSGYPAQTMPPASGRGDVPPPPALPPASMPSPRVRRGRFVPRGSGLDARVAPAPRADEQQPFLLDLTHAPS